MCVCPSRPLPSPFPTPQTPYLCSSSVSVLWTVVDLCLAALMTTAVAKVLNQQVVSPWWVGILCDLHSGWYCAAMPFSLSVKVCQRGTDSQCSGGCQCDLPPPSYLCLCREATPNRVSIQRSADCPSSRMVHQLISESLSSSFVVVLWKSVKSAGTITCVLLVFGHMVKSFFHTFTWHQASRGDFWVICTHWVLLSWFVWTWFRWCLFAFTFSY